MAVWEVGKGASVTSQFGQDPLTRLEYVAAASRYLVVVHRIIVT
jgi:hypothetical protein